MRIVSKNLSKNFIHPAISITVSLLAGKRFIKYFPSSNYCGILASSFCGSGLIILSGLSKKNESHTFRNTRIALSIFCGSALIYLLSSRLKERCSLGFKDATRLITLSIAANLLYGIPFALAYELNKRQALEHDSEHSGSCSNSTSKQIPDTREDTKEDTREALTSYIEGQKEKGAEVGEGSVGGEFSFEDDE